MTRGAEPSAREIMSLQAAEAPRKDSERSVGASHSV
jgi:hypothetical protein